MELAEGVGDEVLLFLPCLSHLLEMLILQMQSAVELYPAVLYLAAVLAVTIVN